MRVKARNVLAIAVVVAAALVLAGATGCDDQGSADRNALEGTAAERAQRILGAAPTGVAEEIVDRGYVVVANDRAYPPQSSIDEATGELVGFDVDVAKKVGEILGLEVQFENPNWETISAGLNQGRYDVSIGSMAVTPEKDKSVDFTEPYYYTTAQAFVRKGGPQIESVADLAGATVGVGIATTAYDLLKQGSEAAVRTYPTDADAFSDLRKGKIDFVVAAASTGQAAIADGEPIEFSGAPLFYEDLAFAVAQGEADWLKLLDYTIAAMREDGTLSALSKQWYSDLDLTVKE